MKTQRAIVIVCAAVVLALPAPSCDAQATVPSVDRLVAPMRQATVAFVGEAVRRGSNVPHVPNSDSTMVIRVIDVLRAPAYLRRLAGREVTIRVDGRAAPARGSRAVHLAYGWVMGGGWAFVEVARFDAPRDQPAFETLWRARLDSAAQTLDDEKLQRSMNPAAAIVLGTIDSIAGADSSAVPDTLGEHHPRWRTAVVRVQRVYRGPGISPGTMLRILFPHSNDIAWRSIEKPPTGATRIFVLHTAREFPSRRGAFDTGDRYFVVRPLDVLPPSQSTRVIKLLP